jgi:hypothetical protein
MTTITHQNGKNYDSIFTDGKSYKCGPVAEVNDSNKNNSGYFFGQGKEGTGYGYLGIAFVVAAMVLFYLADFLIEGNIFGNIIHIFGFTLFNILVLLFIFVLAPFGYQYWLGRCQNNHPGTMVNEKVGSFLSYMPLIASIILIIYPTSLMSLTGSTIQNGSFRTTLIGVMAFFALNSVLRYWPSFFKNVISGGECKVGGGKFTPDLLNFAFYLGFVAIAGFVSVLSIKWFMMAFGGKISLIHGLNPLAILRNILFTLGLVVGNILGGINLFEHKSK